MNNVGLVGDIVSAWRGNLNDFVMHIRKIIGTFAYSSPQDTTIIKKKGKNIVSDSLLALKKNVYIIGVRRLACITMVLSM